MDLYAFANITNLEELANANGIEVPRLRGLRLMSNEEPISPKEIEETKKYSTFYILRDLLTACPVWTNSNTYVFDASSDRRIDYYLIKDEQGDYVGIRWNRIHGKHRKRLKFEIKKKTVVFVDESNLLTKELKLLSSLQKSDKKRFGSLK